jgi:hypothetical protein
VDGAGATLDLINHITALNAVHGRRVHYSVGFDLDHRARAAIGQLGETDWQHVWDRDGEPRDLDGDHAAGVVELTGLLRTSVGGDTLPNWPADMRIYCRRERPSAGAQLCALEEADGWRYQLFATNTGRGQPDFLEARHRSHARVEDRIRCGKTTGLGHLPSTSMAINQAWCVAATIATDLLCWLRLLCLDPALADAEPKTLRYRLLHTAARLVRGQRKRKIKNPRDLALGRRARRRVPRRLRPDRTDLTTNNAHRPRPEGTHRPVEPAPPTRPSGAPARPTPETKITNGGEDHQREPDSRTYPLGE